MTVSAAQAEGERAGGGEVEVETSVTLPSSLSGGDAAAAAVDGGVFVLASRTSRRDDSAEAPVPSEALERPRAVESCS